MNIRIIAVPDDAIVIVCDPKFFTTTRVDESHPDRGGSRLVRFYIEVQLPPDDGAVP